MFSFPFEIGKSLSAYSTFGIGGPARYVTAAATTEEMQERLVQAFSASLPCVIVGKGSNILFDDLGFDGLVIINRIDYLHQNPPFFVAGAGYSFARLGGQTARLGWSGLEFAAGIPATVGGAVYMNAGANGKETKDTLKSVNYITEKGDAQQFKKEELHFAYRSSSFQKWTGAIVEATFELASSESAKGTQKEILNYRLKTQPYKEKSAGCCFRNSSLGAAGKLIEECGLKGISEGNAKVSTLHANFIVNSGGATAKDVLTLIQKIRERVFHQKGILLEEEIRYIPFQPYERFSR